MQPLAIKTKVMVLLAMFSSILKVFEYLKLGSLGFQQYGGWIQISYILQNFNTNYNITHPILLRLYQKNTKFLESRHMQNCIMSRNRLISNMYVFYCQKEQWLLIILGDITCMEMGKKVYYFISLVLRGENKIGLWAPQTNNAKLLRPKSHSPCKRIQEHKGQILHPVFLSAISSKLMNSWLKA